MKIDPAGVLVSAEPLDLARIKDPIYAKEYLAKVMKAMTIPKECPMNPAMMSGPEYAALTSGNKITTPGPIVRRMGRKRPIGKRPRLSLKNYLLKSLPTPPSSVDYTAACAAALGQMYLNDQLGDCVIAAMGHLEGLFTGNAGQSPTVLTSAQVVQLYSAIGGYNPNAPLVPGPGGTMVNPTDNGCDEVTALNYWAQTGVAGNEILGYLAVDPTNVEEVQVAMWLFENLVFGLELPDAYTQVNASGFVWGPGTPDPANGHCVCGVSYSSTGVGIATWGMIGTFLYTAMAQILTPQYGGELYVVLSPDSINKATLKSASGLAVSQLISDFDAIGGSIPQPPVVVPPVTPPVVPPVITPPVVPPTPTPAVTLQQEVDAVFIALELQYKGNKQLVMILRIAENYVDNYIQSYGIHGRMVSLRSAFKVPADIVMVIGLAFTAAETAYPQYAIVFKMVQMILNTYLTTGKPI
jgi:hypothetical protein